MVALGSETGARGLSEAWAPQVFPAGCFLCLGISSAPLPLGLLSRVRVPGSHHQGRKSGPVGTGARVAGQSRCDGQPVPARAALSHRR